MAFAVVSDLQRKGCHFSRLNPSNVSHSHYRLYWLYWDLQPIPLSIINHNCVYKQSIYDKGPKVKRKKFQVIDRCDTIALCIDNNPHLAAGWTIKDLSQTIMSSTITFPQLPHFSLLWREVFRMKWSAELSKSKSHSLWQFWCRKHYV